MAPLLWFLVFGRLVGRLVGGCFAGHQTLLHSSRFSAQFCLPGEQLWEICTNVREARGVCV